MTRVGPYLSLAAFQRRPLCAAISAIALATAAAQKQISATRPIADVALNLQARRGFNSVQPAFDFRGTSCAEGFMKLDIRRLPCSGS